MKISLIATAVGAGVLAGLAVSDARAQTACTTDPATGTTVCDPSTLHVSSPTATGKDPVLLNDTNTFTITEVGNQTINDPIRVYFIQALGAALPSITGFSGFSAGGAFNIPGAVSIDSAPRVLDLSNGLFDGSLLGNLIAGEDFGKQLGIGGGSLSFTNFIAEYTALGLALPNAFQIEEALFNVPGGGFNSDLDFLTVNGNFSLGTIIAPVAVDLDFNKDGTLKKITAFDSPWTETAIVNQLSSPVPEPSTWAMGIIGFGIVGFMGWRRGSWAKPSALSA